MEQELGLGESGWHKMCQGDSPDSGCKHEI
jgi:hypothetical protein